MQPALAQICTLNAPFEQDVEDYAAGACRAIELWAGKLDGYLQKHSPADVRQLLERQGMSAPVLSFQGGLLASQGAFRREHWETFARRLEQCRQLGIGMLVVAADIYGELDEAAVERVRVSLAQAAQQAEGFGVRLALEFQARATFVNNLQTAAELVAEIDHPHLGLCLDVFHYYTGPSKAEDLGYLSTANLFHVQLSDLADVPREFAADADRILPGDGDFQIEPLINHFGTIGYQGHVSVELMNPQIWKIGPRQFGEIAMTALRKVLSQASME